MDHHTSWFSFLPGYQNLVHYLEGTQVFGESTSAGHIYGGVLVASLLMIGSLLVSAHFNKETSVVPKSNLGLSNLFELFTESIAGMMEGIIGHDYKRYIPMVGTFALFIFVSNVLGLIPGFVPPTDNLNTTLALALVVFVWFNFHGLRTQGIGHITHLLNPIGEPWGWALTPLLGLIEIFSLLLRPVTLALRLAANMIADHAVLFAFAGLFALLVPLPFYFLGLLVCVVQTAVFCILSTVYIALHTAEHDH